MKQSSKLFKLVGLLLVLGLLFAALPTGQVLAQATPPYAPDVAIQKAADEIVNSQILPAGGWGLDSEVAPQTLGEIGTALIKAYARTQDPDHLAAINKAVGYLLTKKDNYNYSPADGIFAAELDTLMGGHCGLVKTNFFDKLTAGTYGASENIGTAGYIATMSEYSSLNSHDPALGLMSAYLCGASDVSVWADAVKASLNGVDVYDDYFPFLVATKGIYSLAFTGQTFDPTAGSFKAAADLAGMASQLVTYQQANGSFPVDTFFNEPSVNETAYAILALNQVNPTLYQTQIQAAGNWLLSVQNAAGYWDNLGDENYVSTALSSQAVNAAFPPAPPEVLCTTDCYVDAVNGNDTNLGNAATSFKTIQKGINSVSATGTVHVAAGDYTENLYINKALTLLGPNAGISAGVTPGTRVPEAVIRSLTNFYSIYIPSDDVTIDGFTIDGSGMNPGSAYVLGTYGGGNNYVVQNNVFIGFEAGIPVYSAGGTYSGYRTGIVVKDNSMVNATLGTSGYNFGMWLQSSIATVSGNVVSNFRNGIWVQSYSAPGSATVSGNTFNTYDRGILFDHTTEGSTANWSFVGNKITGIAYPSELTPDRFNAISVERFYGGNVDFEANSILVGASNVPSPLQYSENDVTLGTRDAKGNWWGSAFGPQAPIGGDIDVIQWCADAECKTFAPNEKGEIELSGNVNVPGGIQINVPGLTYHLAADTVIQNASPCFIINADDVLIDAEIGAKCIPTGTSNGIDVAAGLSGIRISGLEIDGVEQDAASTGSGVLFAGALDHFQLLNNYMHDLKGSGVVFAGTPTNNDGIAGNLFKNLGAATIVVPSGLDPDLDAQFNAWGSMAAPAITDVDTSNNTHVSLRIVTSGTFLPDQLAVGQTLTATVIADLSNVTGADYTLSYPANLLEIQSIEHLSGMTLNRPLADTSATGMLRFDASVPLATPIVPITQSGQEMYKVTFAAKAAGTATLSLDELTDLFAMSPSSGYSNHIYAFQLVDKPENILIVADTDTPILESWLPLKGSTLYLNASQQLVLTIDALDSHLYELELDHSLEADPQFPEFSVYADTTNPYGTPEDKALFEAAGVLVTYDASLQTWTINFGATVTDNIITNHSGQITFYAVLKDEFGKTWGSMSPTTVDNTFAYTIIRDVTAPVLETWTLAEGQVILTPTADFVLTVDASDPNLYSLEIDHSLQGTLPEFTVYASASDPTGGQTANYTAAGVSVTYNGSTQTWTITFLNGGTALNAILANKGITFYEVLKDMAGNELGSMSPTTDANTFAYQIYKQQPIVWDSGHTGGALATTVSADGNTINFTGPIAWYPADPVLGRTTGNRVGVEIKAPYLGFDTTLSTLTFDGTTYGWDDVNDGDNYVWVYPKVTAVPQTFTITVNWSASVSQVFTVNVLDTSTLMAPTAFTVQGTISMQGRVYRGDVPINLDGYNADDYAITSQDKLGINFTSNVVLGTYTITTNQPRYLNITADLKKSVEVLGDKTLAALTLRGGNVTDLETSLNIVDLGDAGIIAGAYGATGDTSTLPADANFDGIVNIQDLALVGGNYNLTNTAAYTTWLQP